MPHAVSTMPTGLQALILCGPGASLATFTSNPEECPKALLPIANRPMVWYPLDWCYRMGITNIHLITPPASAKAINAALLQNPHLTSLPSPRADVLAPESLEPISGTAEILRLPEVRAVVQNDVLVLPCDLVCELPGDNLLDTWMAQQIAWDRSKGNSRSQQRGGLGVWYHAKGEGSSKKDETDFLVSAPKHADTASHTDGLPSRDVHQILYTMTKDTFQEKLEAKSGFPIRARLLDQHSRVNVQTTYRDAHIYFLPRWVLEFAAQNPNMDSIGEDVVGWWARASWQAGLSEKLGLDRVLGKDDASTEDDAQKATQVESLIELASMSSTLSVRPSKTSQPPTSQHQDLAPDFLGYIQPATSSDALIRRVDTAGLLLSISLRLAKLPPLDKLSSEDTAPTSPFAHASKIAHPDGVAPKTTINQLDSLLAENVQVDSKCIIKESVIGAGCEIKSGARLTRNLLMESVVVGERSELTGCVIGRRAQIGKGCVLIDCEVQEGNVVPEGTEAKGEKIMVFDGLEGDMDDETGSGLDMGTEDDNGDEADFL